MQDDAISRQEVLETISELNAISFYEAQEDSKECYCEIRQAVENIPSITPQEPCDDAISRDAVLKKIDYEVKHYCKYLEEVDDKRNAQTHVALVSDNIREEVEHLPFVTPIECDDAISCKDIEECEELMTDVNGDIVYAVRMSDIRRLHYSVTQKSKMGHWTRELIRNEKGGCIGAKMICSRCGNDNKHDEYMSYCPNCGVRMEREE